MLEQELNAKSMNESLMLQRLVGDRENQVCSLCFGQLYFEDCVQTAALRSQIAELEARVQRRNKKIKEFSDARRAFVDQLSNKDRELADISADLLEEESFY